MVDSHVTAKSSASRVVWVALGAAMLGLAIVILAIVLFVASARSIDAIAENPPEAANRGGAFPIPADAPLADAYQPFTNADGAGSFAGALSGDPEVIDDSIVLVGVASGPVNEREFYVFKARMGGEVLACAGEFTQTGGGWGCGSGGPAGPQFSGGGSSDPDNGPRVNTMTVEGLGAEAVWVRFAFASGHTVVSDVLGGFGNVEWLGRGDQVIKATSFTADGTVLWSEDAPEWLTE